MLLLLLLLLATGKPSWDVLGSDRKSTDQASSKSSRNARARVLRSASAHAHKSLNPALALQDGPLEDCCQQRGRMARCVSAEKSAEKRAWMIATGSTGRGRAAACTDEVAEKEETTVVEVEADVVTVKASAGAGARLLYLWQDGRLVRSGPQESFGGTGSVAAMAGADCTEKQGKTARRDTLRAARAAASSPWRPSVGDMLWP